jgi:hypothetical protein
LRRQPSVGAGRRTHVHAHAHARMSASRSWAGARRKRLHSRPLIPTQRRHTSSPRRFAKIKQHARLQHQLRLGVQGVVLAELRARDGDRGDPLGRHLGCARPKLHQLAHAAKQVQLPPQPAHRLRLGQIVSDHTHVCAHTRMQTRTHTHTDTPTHPDEYLQQTYFQLRPPRTRYQQRPAAHIRTQPPINAPSHRKARTSEPK